MGIELANVWSKYEPLIDDGYSIMPVYDRHQFDRKQREKKPKDPCLGTWKPLQSRRMDRGELYSALEYYDTTGVAVICGAISGNLECIDVDSKYNPGIDALLLNRIKEIYPDIFPRLRIHKTPSGGRHIIYRVSDHKIEGSQELAFKYEEGGKGKKIKYIETRGEGGYFLFPPSSGYTIVHDVPMPVITWEERCGLINICRSFSDVIKMAPMPKVSKSMSNWYSVNPFEDYDYNCDPVALMEEFGWRVFGRPEGKNYIQFTRPGKDSGTSASFICDKRVFKIFTTSTNLEGERGYRPATLLSHLKFDGDSKLTYKFLVEKGFGKFTSKTEEIIVEKAIRDGNTGPKNLSSNAKKAIEEGKAKSAEQYPFKKFWEFNEKDVVNILLKNLIDVVEGIGYVLYNGVIYRKDVESRVLNQVFDLQPHLTEALEAYIKEDEVTKEKISNALTEKLSTKLKYIKGGIPKMDKELLLCDKRDVCYKFYRNCIIEITAESVEIHDYDFLEITDKYIFYNQKQNRCYDPSIESSNLYSEFLTNSTGYTDNVKNIIGWLSHEIKCRDRAYMVVLSEMAADELDGGGAGKSLFGEMLAYTTTRCEVDGGAIEVNDTLFQSWRNEKVFVIGDTPKYFSFAKLKNVITNNSTIKRLYSDRFDLPFEETPKILMSTNFSCNITDGGLKRRVRTIEFTNFYSGPNGPNVVHEKMFPHDFDDSDWKSFDDVIIESVQHHLKVNGIIKEQELSDSGWKKMFNNKYGEKTIEFIEDNIDKWLRLDFVEVKIFQQEYNEYLSLYEKQKLHPRLLNTALKEFCEKFNIKFQQSIVKKVAYQTKRVHIFTGEYQIPSNLNESEDGLPF
ncbi:bifunctional DNA primase/polymerase [Sphingobacterium spiritivorum]|uniref:bifunctional DNA primase/polymerase n=1 Tax=Sphingobacterium spiritivorum TaxID=258 RepID=UPI00191ADAD9|nr:bifunctional DNA primase/polymerase [Sphingobacterium spiritivorum]QQT26845.1 bifunctional DNA primase/polymerase [Sphingobacterium spiritivorum]